MANLRVTVNVPQGSVATAGPDQSIGTDGCGPCVGLIVVDKSNRKTCAHFDSSRADCLDGFKIVWSRTSNILRQHFPPASEVAAIGICSTSYGEPSTSAIIDAIYMRYGKMMEEGALQSMGIVANKAGVIKPLGMTDNVTTLPALANDIAAIQHDEYPGKQKEAPSYIA